MTNLFSRSLICTLVFFISALSNQSFSQVSGVAINDDNSSADASAMLDVNVNTSSSKKGLLIPRVTTTQRDAISSPATGLLIFNSTTGWFEYNAGTPSSINWVPLLSSSSGWKITGNAGTTAGTNFLGTTDNTALVLKVNNTNAGFIDNSASSNNLYFGLSAGNYTTSSGTNNTAIGSAALLANTSGSNNTAIGSQSLSGVTTGSNNTALGYNTATNNSSATAIGAAAQANNLQATAIGASASASGSNATAIGYNASTSQNNAFILGNNSVNVGIGTSTPNTSAKLDVNGSFKLGSGGTLLSNLIKTTGSLNANVVFPLLNLGTVTGTITVSGATTNETVIINPRTALLNGVSIAYAYVSAANTITIVFSSVLINAGTINTTAVFDITLIQ